MGRLLLEPQANAPADATSKTRGGLNDAYFDTNMVIILAALLCALICALSLNSALRCVLRITRRLTSDDQVANASNANANSGRLVATTGIKKRALEQIPVGLYGSGNIDMKATECLICLGDFVDGEKVRVLPKCNHGFHVRCIDTWLVSRSSCPTCRQSLLVEQPSPMAVSRRDEDVV
ncbi:PREDICTED: RING-H2 finger protein ATL72-like [Camelina sativa]|uniref:RING-type E3 ubiquitin transferase n=1 Tax=Camelina sativa TaxID=90675 RepID=A0ABM1R0Z0_CAMSA|nr:PREDICTED: RING-H2 finger protein ATL72-like [Camelina sativa]